MVGIHRGVSQRVQVSLWYILRPAKYPISIYHNDTWTLWDAGCQKIFLNVGCTELSHRRTCYDVTLGLNVSSGGQGSVTVATLEHSQHHRSLRAFDFDYSPDL